MKREANNGEIEFLRAEVLTGANVSRELRWGHEVKNKNRRNRVNARKAHDSLLRFMAHVTAKTALVAIGATFFIGVMLRILAVLVQFGSRFAEVALDRREILNRKEVAAIAELSNLVSATARRIESLHTESTPDQTSSRNLWRVSRQRF